MSLNGFKESVSAIHFCHLCDIQNNDLEEDVGHQFDTITAAQYKERFVSKKIILTLNKFLLKL